VQIVAVELCGNAGASATLVHQTGRYVVNKFSVKIAEELRERLRLRVGVCMSGFGEENGCNINGTYIALGCEGSDLILS